MRYGVVLAITLFGLWLLLSGYWHNTLLVSLGAGSSLLVVLLVSRMGIVDSESAAMPRTPFLSGYWGWLSGEIVKANWDVARIILTPDLDITPRLVQTRTDQRSDLAAVVFANSITLTPGTVSVEIKDNTIVIHALTASMAEPQAFQTMGAFSKRVIDGDSHTNSMKEHET